MSKRKIVLVENGAYFFTSRLVGGKNLFANNRFADIIIGSLKWFRDKGDITLFSFVVMPDHVHFLFQPTGARTVKEIAHSFSKFTSKEILKTCWETDDSDFLQLSKRYGEESGDREYRVWNDSLIVTVDKERFLKEKMEYIHNNPIAKGWDLCGMRTSYKYSSACFYDMGQETLVEIDDPFG